MTYSEVFPIWWSFIWRGFLGGVIAGAIAGGLVGFVLGLSGNPGAAGQWGSIAGTLIGIPVSLWAMRAAINKHGLVLAPKPS